MSFALIAMLGILPSGLGQLSKSIDEGKAQTIGQQILSEAKQTDYLSIASGGTYSAFYDGDMERQASANEETVYTAVITVTVAAGSPVRGRLLKLEVQILKAPAGVVTVSRPLKRLVGLVTCKDLSLLPL